MYLHFNRLVQISILLHPHSFLTVHLHSAANATIVSPDYLTREISIAQDLGNHNSLLMGSQ